MVCWTMSNSVFHIFLVLVCVCVCVCARVPWNRTKKLVAQQIMVGRCGFVWAVAAAAPSRYNTSHDMASHRTPLRGVQWFAQMQINKDTHTHARTHTHIYIYIYIYIYILHALHARMHACTHANATTLKYRWHTHANYMCYIHLCRTYTHKCIA